MLRSSRNITIGLLLLLYTNNSLSQTLPADKSALLKQQKFDSLLSQLIKADTTPPKKKASLYDIGNDSFSIKKFIKEIPDSIAFITIIGLDSSIIVLIASDNIASGKSYPIPSSKFKANLDLVLRYIARPDPNYNNNKILARGGKISSYGPNSQMAYKEAITQFYKWIWEPIREKAGTKKYLCINPNGNLWNFPFELLQSSFISTHQDPKAIDSAVIYYCDQLKYFQYRCHKTGEKLKIAAFGNPDESLQFSANEVRGIKQLYPATEVFEGNAATVNNVREQLKDSLDILHFATHAVLKDSALFESYLLLANDGNNNGQFTLRDLVKDRLKTHCIILSACNTAHVPANSSASFSNMLNFSGIHTLVATQWAVDDQASQVLINSYYKHLKKYPPAIAMDKAKTEIKKIKKYAHPYYWSGYIVIGEGL